MLRQPFVDERVVRVKQIQDAAVLVHDAVEEQLDLAPERLPQVVVEVRIEVDQRIVRSRSARTFSHWPVKLVTNDSDFGSASIRRTCCSSTAGSFSRPCAATVISSSSGMLLQRKNDSREASARSLRR